MSSMPAMKNLACKLKIPALAILAGLLILAALPLAAEDCQNALEMDSANRTAMEAAAKQYFNYIAHNDAASLQQHAIGSLAANFSGVQAAVASDQPILGGATAATR